MKHSISLLVDILKQECEIYKGLLEISEQKKDILMQGDVDALDDMVSREKEALQKISSLERMREDTAGSVALEQSISAQNVRLEEIIETCSGKEKDALERIKSELEEVVEALSINNAHNKMLIDTQLQYSAFCIEMLTGQTNMTNTYTNSGKVSDTAVKRSLLDQTV